MRLALCALVLVCVSLAAVRSTPAQTSNPTCTVQDLAFIETDITEAQGWVLSCSNPTATTGSATYNTVDGSAKSPGDYIAQGDVRSVPPGASTHIIAIPITGDDTGEPTDLFSIRFEDPSGFVKFVDDTGFEKQLSLVTIDDDDGFTVSSISQSAPEGDSGSSSVNVEVRLSDPVDRPFNVSFAAQDGTATAGADYEATSVGLTFQPGETSLTTPVTILGDTSDEPDEYIFLALGIEGTATLTSGALTIVDDDEASAAPCILLSENSMVVNGAEFSTPTNRRIFGGDPRFTIENCGSSDVNLKARGTDLTGSGATWELTDASSGGPIDSTCDLGLDLFRSDVFLLNLPTGEPGIGTPITNDDKFLLGAGPTRSDPFVVEAGAVQESSVQIETPCVGSSGEGVEMSMDVVLTAVAAP